MTQLKDIIQINPSKTPAAVVVGQSLSDHQLVELFAPTKAAVTVLKHLKQAVLPPEGHTTTQEQRALNIHGSYGSGKSHLAVVIAQLLRDGSGYSEFEHLFERLRLFGEADLAKQLKNAFLSADDTNAKPYLLVSLYGSGTTSLAAKLIEGLYDALERHPELNPTEILPITEYEVCVKHFDYLAQQSPELKNADLSKWQLSEHYLTTEEMMEGLKHHQTLALELFKRWHKAVCYVAFDPVREGGSNFIQAYVEAGKNLAEKHSFSGIVVVWDEFGLALEDLISNPHRNVINEIFALQEFVEKACSPRLGHTIFIGLTHKEFAQYAANADDAIKNRLETIFGRFRAFKIELSAAESEGYHLLGMQRSWTEFGKQHWTQAKERQAQLVSSCAALPLFKSLGQQLTEVSGEIYPLHPIMAAGLFALSALAQANRTALTFFRYNAEKILAESVNEHALFGEELIRLPELVDYYSETLAEKKAHELERYQRAKGKIPSDLNTEEYESKLAILKLLLLNELLDGGKFHTNETFLSCALYDVPPTSSAAERLHSDLAWLKAAELIWKNDLTQQWTLLGDSGVDVERLIEEKLPNFTKEKDSFEKLLNDPLPLNTNMREDLFPVLGVHDLEPSPCGIVRSYEVKLLTPPIVNSLKLNNPLLSGQVYLVLAKDAEEVTQVKARILETPAANIYFWLPTAGVHSESVSYNKKEFKLGDLLCRYLALKLLLKEKSATDDVRRQLTAKWEKTRKDILQILQVLYGREGLSSGKSQILKAGTAQALACKSWYEFRGVLAEQIQALYPKEIPIRAMNINALYNEKLHRNHIVRKITKQIIEFDNNPTYQTDLLGNKDSSEESALIDGVLGANQLFIQRLPDKWDIKKVEESEGLVKEVLTLLHKTLLLKRDGAYKVSDLREKLIAPPYGIPSCNLAILAAVAIRHEIRRLRWSSNADSDFSVNLANAFLADSKLSIRLFEFTDKQFALLYMVGQYFKMVKPDNQSQQEFGSECAAKLREFVKNKADAVKFSNQLHDKAKELVKFLQSVPTKNAQDLADFVLILLELSNKSPSDIHDLAPACLKNLLGDFERIENLKKHEIKQTLQQVCPQNTEDKAQLVARLNHHHTTPQAKAVAQLLEQHQDVANIDVGKVTQLLLNKPIEHCSDTEIGQCKGELKSLITHHQQPLIISNEINKPAAVTSETLISNLRQHIEASKLPKVEIKQVLQQLIHDYTEF